MNYMRKLHREAWVDACTVLPAMPVSRQQVLAALAETGRALRAAGHSEDHKGILLWSDIVVHWKFWIKFSKKKKILKKPFVSRWNSLVSGEKGGWDNDFHHQRGLNSWELSKGIAAHNFSSFFQRRRRKGVAVGAIAKWRIWLKDSWF